MNGFEAYKTYLALKNHFTRDSYDYFKYNGKVNVKLSSFESRRDRFYFDKIAKHRDVFGYLLSNIIVNTNTWVGELVSSDTADKNYKRWARYNQSLNYCFGEDVKKIEDFDASLSTKNSTHPTLLKMYLSNKINIETLVILLDMTGCYSKWNRSMEYDPLWNSVSTLVIKYQPFIKYDLNILTKNVVDIFSERV